MRTDAKTLIHALVSFVRLVWATLRGTRAFHCRIPLANGYDLALWERPGELLSDLELVGLVDDLRAVAARSSGEASLTLYGPLLYDREEQTQRLVAVVYRRSDGRPLAFNAQRYFEIDVNGRRERIVHLGLVCVDPRARGRRVCHWMYYLSNIVLLVHNRFRRYWISNVTQVPSVVGQVSQHYDRVFPSPDPDARQTPFHRAAARQLFESERAAFGVGDDATYDPGRQIIRNAYTGGSDHLKKAYRDAPKARDARVNHFCRYSLDYEQGDDFLQIASWGIRTTLGHVLRLDPKPNRKSLEPTEVHA